MPFKKRLLAAIIAASAGGGGGGGGFIPTYSLDFTSTLPAQVTFSRAGARSATVAGVVGSVATNTPAIESWDSINRGLSIEPASTNSALQSNTFTTTWGQVNIATPVQTITGPDGNTSGWQVAETTASGFHELNQNFTSVGSGVVMTTSFYMKQMSGSATNAAGILNCNQFNNTGARACGMVDGSNTTISFDTNTTGGGAATFTNVSSGTQVLANGWVRVWITGTTTTSGTKTVRLRTLSLTVSGAENFAGSATNGAVLAFAQTEFGVSRPTSYKATTTAAAGSSADVATISDLSWLNAAQGTLYIEHDVSNGGPVLGSGVNTIIPGTISGKTVLTWDGSTSDLITNGGATTAGGIPTFGATLSLLAANGLTNIGHIKKLQYQPARISVAQAQALTAPLSTAQPGVMRIAVDHAKMPNASLTVAGTTPSQATDATRTIVGARSKLRAVVGNWYCNDTSGDVSIPNTVTATAALIRVATGEVAQIKFSGTQAYVMASGLVIMESDDILPSAFPSLAAGGVFPDGDVFRTKSIISCGSGGLLPVGTYAGETNTVAYSYDAAVTNMSTVNSAAAFSVTGTGPTVLVGANKCFTPVLVGPFVSGDPATAMATGDSIFEGVAPALQTSGTWVQTAAKNLGIPLLIYSLGGNSQVYTWKSSNIYQWMKYARILIDNLGTNTQGGILYYPLSYSKARTAGINFILRPSLLQRSTSTDNFATLANQTSTLVYPDLNDLALISLAANGMIDVYYKTTATRDTGDKWISNGTANFYTLDGTHPSQPGDTLNAAELQPYLAAAAAALT